MPVSKRSMGHQRGGSGILRGTVPSIFSSVAMEFLYTVYFSAIITGIIGWYFGKYIVNLLPPIPMVPEKNHKHFCKNGSAIYQDCPKCMAKSLPYVVERQGVRLIIENTSPPLTAPLTCKRRCSVRGFWYH